MPLFLKRELLSSIDSIREGPAIGALCSSVLNHGIMPCQQQGLVWHNKQRADGHSSLHQPNVPVTWITLCGNFPVVPMGSSTALPNLVQGVL